MARENTVFFDLDGGQGAESSPLFFEMPFYFEGGKIEGAAGFVSARAAGSMNYAPDAENPARDRFLRLLGAARRFDPSPVFSCSQVHSRRVVRVDRAAPGVEADGMIAGGGAVTLAVTVADCLPVFLYDTATGARALAHSGWKGTGIAVAALEMMSETFGTRAENVAALFGPCIQGESYTVSEERRRVFDAEFGGNGTFVRQCLDRAGGRGEDAWPLGPVTDRRDDRAVLRLQAANARILAAAGVRNFSVCRNDTFTDTRLGSYRREGADHYTKMIAVFPPPESSRFIPEAFSPRIR